MKRIAVTGYTGFVGKRLIEYDKDRYSIVPLSLRTQNPGELDLQNIDAVVHLAGKAHDMGEVNDSIYFNINYELTKTLADRAKEQGVKHFIYASSTKVYGDDINGVLNESSPCIPADAYGASKLQAEQYLQSIQSDQFKIAILRPPLVYGPEVKGNMIRLLKLASKNIPLPFGRIGNARSMVFVDNLVALINAIIDSEATGIFIAGDSGPIATDELILLMRNSLGNTKGLISIPGFLRNILKRVRPALYIRMFGSFVVDNSLTNRQLNFTPPYSTAYGVEQMVRWFTAGLRSDK